MERVNVVNRVPFKLARQIEEDLQDQWFMEMVTIVMTWAKSRGISLDKLEGCVLGPYKTVPTKVQGFIKAILLAKSVAFGRAWHQEKA